MKAVNLYHSSDPENMRQIGAVDLKSSLKQWKKRYKGSASEPRLSKTPKSPSPTVFLRLFCYVLVYCIFFQETVQATDCDEIKIGDLLV